ncbi:MAG: hypothetical protein ACPLN0_07845 [Candidatus Hydrothermia bacterium]
MSNLIFPLLFSWYSFFSVNATDGYFKDGLFYNSNPALNKKFENSIYISGKFWDSDTKIAEFLGFRSNFSLDFVFYNFGYFPYSGLVPDDYLNLNYAAFAYKVALGYVIPFESNFFFGIQPQYQRFEYHNFYAEGITLNIGLLGIFGSSNLPIQIYFRDFGFGSNQGFNFPASFNFETGYYFKERIFLNAKFTQDFAEGLDKFFKKQYLISVTGFYNFRHIIWPGFSFYLGDDLRIASFQLKIRPKGRLGIFYSVVLRKEHFGPVQSLTLGVE